MPRLLQDWLQSYLEYTAEQEAPEKIHLWTALTLLSASVRRQFYMDLVFYHLFPNIYVLIVAESARARKSVAMEMGIDILTEAVPDIFIMRGRMTPEGLVKSMNRSKTVIDQNRGGTIYEDSHVFIFADELATLFGYDRQSASRMSMLLTEIYASKREYPHTTASDGVWMLYNLYPTLLAATDPRNLKVLPEEAIAGLLGRLIFVVAGERRRSTAWADKKKIAASRTLRAALVSDLQKVAALNGVCEPTEEAKVLFATWYDRINEHKVTDHRIEPFLARCHDTARKIAMLIGVSRSDRLVVEAEHMAGGIAIVEKLLPEALRVVHWTGATAFSQNRVQFIEALRRLGGYATRRAVLRAVGIPAEDLDIIENTLKQEGVVETRIVGRELYYRLTGEE